MNRHSPKLLQAKTVGVSAIRRLRMHRNLGRVHSIFKQVFNIVTEDEKLISVVSKNVGSGPINIVVDLPRDSTMFSLHVNQGQPVLSEGDMLLINRKVQISMKYASMYKPCRHFKTLELNTIKHNLEIVKKVASSEGNFAGIGELMKCLTSNFDIVPHSGLNKFASDALFPLSSLVTNAKEERYSDLYHSAMNLIGLGPGLTPSADDALAGLMAALLLVGENLGVKCSRLRSINEVIISCVNGNMTTLFSMEFLRHAASGEVNEQMMTLIEAVLTSDSVNVIETTKKLLSIGETSGTDILLGLLLGTMLAIEFAEGM